MNWSHSTEEQRTQASYSVHLRKVNSESAYARFYLVLPIASCLSKCTVTEIYLVIIHIQLIVKVFTFIDPHSLSNISHAPKGTCSAPAEGEEESTDLGHVGIVAPQVV